MLLTKGHVIQLKKARDSDFLPDGRKVWLEKTPTWKVVGCAHWASSDECLRLAVRGLTPAVIRVPP
jgi:hypothetical protein